MQLFYLVFWGVNTALCYKPKRVMESAGSNPGETVNLFQVCLQFQSDVLEKIAHFHFFG